MEPRTVAQVVIAEKVSAPAGAGLSRPRIAERIGDLQRTGLGFVHGPAGIGKTTALGQLAEAWAGPVSWLRLDPGDGAADRIVSLLLASLGLEAEQSAVVDSVIAEFERSGRRDHLLVIDDLHTVVGALASASLARLIQYRPAGLAILASSRFDGTADHTHLVLAQAPFVLDFEDLRFRLWEVDELMRGHFKVTIAPDDLHLLSRYTEGWAAALQLFSVAGRSAPTDTRRRMIQGLRTSAGMVHGYLSQEVLSTLAADQRSFLLASSVFEHLTPDRCNALLGIESAGATLRSLSGLGLFAEVDEIAHSYRCHDLLRTHLLGELTEADGQLAVNLLHLRAGLVAEREGAVGEAIRYYARGDDLDAVARLVGDQGDLLAQSTGSWLDALPPAFIDQDPFVLLTSARRELRQGDLEGAATQYAKAMALFEANDTAARQCRHELRLVEAWLSPSEVPGLAGSWIVVARHQLEGRSGPLPASATGFNVALDEFLQGRLDVAADRFREVEAAASGMVGVVAGAAHLVIDTLAAGHGACSPEGLRRLHSGGKDLNAQAVIRVAEALARAAPTDDAADILADQAAGSRDLLGLGLIRLVRGVCLVHDGRAVGRSLLDLATEAFRAGGYGALAELSAALAAASTDDRVPLTEAERGARPRSSLAQALHLVARSKRATADAEQLRGRARRLGEHCGAGALIDVLLWSPEPAAEAAGDRARQGPVGAPAGPGRVRVLGQFAVLDSAGVESDLALTPQHREILAYLCCRLRQWTHSDQIVGEFWPDRDEQRARRSMQVAISSVRRGLEEASVGTVERDGARYRLAFDDGWRVDLAELDDLLRRRSDAGLGDDVAAIRRAHELFAELVTDMGATGWAVAERKALQFRLTQRTTAAAGELRELGDAGAAHELARMGLQVDQADDQLWTIAIETAGQARSVELRMEYERMLADLGVSRPETQEPAAG